MGDAADGLGERDEPPGGNGTVSRRESAPAAGNQTENYDWIGSLSAVGPVREDAIRRLHALMLRASRFTLARMGDAARLGHARAEMIVQSSADDAVVAILARLSTFQGRARFTTWAYKFAILHTTTAVRREVWSHTEVALSSIPEPRARTGDPLEHVENAALADAVRRGIAESLTPHQRRILIAIAIEGIPIDVIADRLSTSRNTVYKTLHDARRRLRENLIAQGHLDSSAREEVKR